MSVFEYELMRTDMLHVRERAYYAFLRTRPSLYVRPASEHLSDNSLVTR